MGRIRLFDLTLLDKKARERSELSISNSAENPRQEFHCCNQFRCHTKMITSISWYPLDNGLFLSGSTDQFVNVYSLNIPYEQVWDTERFSIVSHIRYKHPVVDVEMPPSESFIHKMAAVCSGLNGISLIDLFSGNTTQEVVGGPEKATCCCWNPKYVKRYF